MTSMKKRSERRSSSKEPPEPVFFVDADICGRPFIDLLRAAGFSLALHNEHFGQGTPDEIWLEVAGRSGWIVLTHDKRLIKDSFRVQTLMQASTRVFTLIGDPHQNPSGAKGHFLRGLADNVLACRGGIDAFLRRHRDPFIARIYRPRHDGEPPAARIRMVLRYEDWLRG